MNKAREPVRIVPKGWGREVWIANGEQYCGKILEIRKGKRCSLHYHKLKDRIVLSALRPAQVANHGVSNSSVVGEFILNAGECMDVPSGLVHQMEAVEDAELYEFSTQHFDSDSYRLVRGD